MAAGPSTSYVELKQTLCDVLEKRGVMENLRAQVRAELFAEIDSTPSYSSPKAPPPPRETILLNELFRDYLKFNGYEHTLSVFLAETAQPREPALDRTFLKRELGISEELQRSNQASHRFQPSQSPRGCENDEIPLCYALLADYDRVKEMQATLAPLVRRHEALQRSDSLPLTSAATRAPRASHSTEVTGEQEHGSAQQSDNERPPPFQGRSSGSGVVGSTAAVAHPLFLESTSSSAAFSPLRTADLVTSTPPSADDSGCSGEEAKEFHETGAPSITAAASGTQTDTRPGAREFLPVQDGPSQADTAGGLLVISGSGQSPSPRIALEQQPDQSQQTESQPVADGRVAGPAERARGDAEGGTTAT